MDDYQDLISSRLYDRDSTAWGKYKVVKYLGKRGKTMVKYFLIKFKNSGNEIETSLKNILEGNVIDIEEKKKNTKKKNKIKKKEKKEKKDWVTKYLHSPKNIISLDLASESTGVCVSRNGKIIYYNYIYHKKDSSDPNNLVKRLNYMKNEIIKVCKEYNIDSASIEAIPFMGSKQVLFVLSQIRALVKDYFYESKIQCISVSAMAWENWLVKKRYSNLETKERTIRAIKDDYKIDIRAKFPGKNENEIKKEVWFDVSDAIGILLYTLKNRIRD